MKKLVLIWSMVLMAALTVVACETQEETAPPATTEQPAETVEQPAETVEPPAETVEPPAETVEPPAEQPAETPENEGRVIEE
ncbi:MAG: hypothetical protein R2940_04785 [Syntrophotaleaceae bacterium]